MEVVPLSLMLLLHRPAWASFFLKRQPTVLVSTPADALQLAEILRKNTMARAKPQAVQTHRRPARQRVQARRAMLNEEVPLKDSGWLFCSAVA